MLAVVGALLCNALIAVLKFVAAGMTGSSGMMAEALHSLADTTNQIFLLLGLRFYRRPASEKHPFGYGKERFFWSFIAAVFIFGVGATYAIYEGVTKLYHPHTPERLVWAYGVLAGSFLLEGVSISIAIYQEMREAIRRAILEHPNVVEVVELLTMHLAPKKILINAHVNFRDELETNDIERSIRQIERNIRRAEPMVDMIFLETARQSEPGPDEPIPQHIG